jgi:hypothetical protein
VIGGQLSGDNIERTRAVPGTYRTTKKYKYDIFVKMVNAKSLLSTLLPRIDCILMNKLPHNWRERSYLSNWNISHALTW